MPVTTQSCLKYIIIFEIVFSLSSCFLNDPSVTVHEGEKAVLTCSITSRIPTWTGPFGGRINSNDFTTAQLSYVPPRDKNRITVKSNGQLVINVTKRTDRGHYKCSYPGLSSETISLNILDPLSTTTKSVSLKTECCICDDSDSSKLCSAPDTCKRSFHFCDFCETEKRYTGQDWKITRRCGTKASCVTKVYQTASDSGCSTEPRRGTTCFTCCGRKTIHDNPFYCQLNPDANFGLDLTTLPVASSSTTKKSTQSTTTTRSSTITTLAGPTVKSTLTSQSTIEPSTSASSTSTTEPSTSTSSTVKTTPASQSTTKPSTLTSSKTTTQQTTRKQTTPQTAVQQTTTKQTPSTLSRAPHSTLGTTSSWVTVYVHEGEQAVLKCSITTNIPMWTGPPNGGIINFADSSRINPFFVHRDRISVGTDGQLMINNTRRYDSGNYVCTYPGMGMETIVLVIGDKPSTVRASQSTSDTISTTAPSKTLALTNMTSTSVQTTVKTSTVVSNKASTVRASQSTSDSISTPGPSKTSIPMFSALTNMTSTSARTTVKTSTVVSMYGHEGEQVVLKCSITTNIPMWTGPPNGGIINFADSSQINPVFAHRDRISVGRDGQLMINNTKPYDSGTYVCTYPGIGMETITLVSWALTNMTATSAPTTMKTSTVVSNGGWTAWTSWTGCSSDCKGIQVRIRTCSKPFPSNGVPCPGLAFEQETCNANNCKVPYETRGPTTIALTTTGQTSSSSDTSTSPPGATSSAPTHSNLTSGMPGSSKSSARFTKSPSSANITQMLTTTSRRNIISSTASILNSSLTSTNLIQSTSTSRTTKKSFATIPPAATKCAVCAGPPEACEIAFYEDYCQYPNNYCINHISNLDDGRKLVDRRCGNVSTCYNEWYLGSSDDDKCRQLSSSTVLTYKFECTYCCIKNGCNVDLHPKADTLYSNTGR